MMVSNTFSNLTRPQRAERRKTAIHELKKGVSQAEVARKHGVSRNAVSKWWKAYQEKGKATYKPRFSPGRPPRLTSTQKKKLKNIILEGPISHGWKTDLWTTTRVVALIERKFGVSYHPDHVGKLLHGIGFSWQKPQRRAAERDEKEVHRWIKQEWPRIKKNASPSARR
jgi:transposase